MKDLVDLGRASFQELPLSVRSHNSLYLMAYRLGFCDPLTMTVADLSGMDEKMLLGQKGIGPKQLNEIREVLSRYGVVLNEDGQGKLPKPVVIVPDPLIEDARGNMIAPDIGERMIDKAIAAGYKFEDLRWLMSRTQRRMLLKSMRMVSPAETLRPEIENGVARGSGMFLGIPYIVGDVCDGVIVLQVVEEKERVGMIDELAVDYRESA